MSIPVRAVFAVAFLSACAQTYNSTPEYINAPVNLSVKMIATQTYELSFYSDNREGNFAGYGLFTGASAAALNTSFDINPPAQSDAAGFCTLGAQVTYGTVVAIQTGPGAAGIPVEQGHRQRQGHAAGYEENDERDETDDLADVHAEPVKSCSISALFASRLITMTSSPACRLKLPSGRWC